MKFATADEMPDTGAIAERAAVLTRQFGGVANAQLPTLYVQAKTGLAKCSKLDECKSWADKAEAIRSYARQAGDLELMKTAMRIKTRATERLGSLLEEFEKAQGKRSDLVPTAEPSSPRRQAASEAGISKKQAHQAQAVARYAKNDPAGFDKAIDGDEPATITELAKRGRKPAPPPRTDHLMGATPEEFAVGTSAMGWIRDTAKMFAKSPPDIVVKTAAPHERKAMLRSLKPIGEWVAHLTSLLEKTE